MTSLQWRHEHNCVSDHQPHDCLLKRLFGRRSKKTSKLRVTGLCTGNSPGTGEFPAQMASNAENVSIWWRHHDIALAWWYWGPVMRSNHSVLSFSDSLFYLNNIVLRIEAEILSFRWKFHRCLHKKLSKLQLLMQQVMKILFWQLQFMKGRCFPNFEALISMLTRIWLFSSWITWCKLYHVIVKRLNGNISTKFSSFAAKEDIIFTRGQFWPSGIVVACVCLCVCVSVRASITSLSAR